MNYPSTATSGAEIPGESPTPGKARLRRRGAVLILALIAGCQTVSTNQAELAASKKEFLLAQSGFKVITVTTPSNNRLSML